MPRSGRAEFGDVQGGAGGTVLLRVSVLTFAWTAHASGAGAGIAAGDVRWEMSDGRFLLGEVASLPSEPGPGFITELRGARRLASLHRAPYVF